jgi:hypothetical protein
MEGQEMMSLSLSGRRSAGTLQAVSLAFACLVLLGVGKLHAEDKPAPGERVNPEVLAPDEFRMTVELTRSKMILLSSDRTKIPVLRPEDGAGAEAKKDIRRFLQLVERLQPSRPAAPPPGPGLPGTAPRRNSFFAPRALPPTAPGDKTPKMVWVELDKLEQREGVKLAEDILPLRMAVVAAAFPYKKQLEEFRKALGTRAADKEIRPQFEGLLIERLEIGPDGKSKGWEPLDLEQTLLPLFFVTRERFEPEDPDLNGVLFDGLVVPRPVPFGGRSYPQIERQLEHIKDSLLQLKKNGKGVPEYCLVRFLDVTIEPGKSYEYRFKIKLRNPNYAYPLSRPKELVSGDWVQVPGRLTVDATPSYYPVDQQDLDRKTLPGKEFLTTWRLARPPRPNQVMFQAHVWADFVYQDPLTRRASMRYAVGDWVIAERYPVYRGEYVGGVIRTEVPIWNSIEEKFVLASTGKDNDRTIPVLFGEDDPENNPLLVDFEGGELVHDAVRPRAGEEKERIVRITDKAPVQALLLMPDGKLLVRDSETDAQDNERLERRAIWQKRISELKPKLEPGNKPGERPNPFDPEDK